MGAADVSCHRQETNADDWYLGRRGTCPASWLAPWRSRSSSACPAPRFRSSRRQYRLQGAVQNHTPPGSGGTFQTSQPQRTGWDKARERMVRQQMENRDIDSRRVLEAMHKVPRHLLVPKELRHEAYADHPLPIGHGQTISQPYIVALMTQLAPPESEDRALDVGTGSGYQAAVLAELVNDVYSIEIVAPLAESALEPQESRLRQRRGPLRRWLPRLATACAVRCDHRRGRARPCPPAACRSAGTGRPSRHSVGNSWQSLQVLEKDAAGKVRGRTSPPSPSCR